MISLSYNDAYQVLLLQAADEGRSEPLFGDSLARAKQAVPPFLVGKEFPSVYLEHPLAGNPFLDVTVLLGELEPGTRVDSPAAGDASAMLDWYAQTRPSFQRISFGFELDTKEPALPTAAVHFQPRADDALVRPFCEAAGEPKRADLYLNQAARMPQGWQLSFFGLFRGRSASPLRVCGYLDDAERQTCAADPTRLADAFDAIGFAAYDSVMLEQAAALMAAAPVAVDFQFDIYPDGSLGETFAIDVQFGIEQPKAVQNTFRQGPGLRVMKLLENMGAADDRWQLAVQSAFARAIPARFAGGEAGMVALTLMPQWVKARWTDRAPQVSKLYHYAHAQILDKEQ